MIRAIVNQNAYPALKVHAKMDIASAALDRLPVGKKVDVLQVIGPFADKGISYRWGEIAFDTSTGHEWPLGQKTGWIVLADAKMRYCDEDRFDPQPGPAPALDEKQIRLDEINKLQAHTQAYFELRKKEIDP